MTQFQSIFKCTSTRMQCCIHWRNEKHYQNLTQRNIGYYSDLAVNEWFRPWVKQQLVAKFWGRGHKILRRHEPPCLVGSATYGMMVL